MLRTCGIEFFTILELAFHVRNAVDDYHLSRVGISLCPMSWAESVVWDHVVRDGLVAHLSDKEQEVFIETASRAILSVYTELEELLTRFGVTEENQCDVFVEDFIDCDAIVSIKRR